MSDTEPDHPRCPDHPDETLLSHDPNGDPTGDYYCGHLRPRCQWVALVGWGMDAYEESMES